MKTSSFQKNQRNNVQDFNLIKPFQICEAVMTPDLVWSSGRDGNRIEELHECLLVIYRQFEQLNP
ncbi:hypothetical protein ACIG6B_09130 [Bacillus mobilis]|uniref:hypothetical protein n=1 Tax=Bacillus mobilis TaxID=2026190 RepID=UPI003628F6D9